MAISQVNLERVGPPVSDEDIDALESRLGVKLPEDYRAFLKKHNGGSVWPRHAKHEDIHYFLRIDDPSNTSSIEHAWKAFKDPENPRMPPEFMPIAVSYGYRNLICLVIDGPNKGQVFAWYRLDEGWPTYTYDNLHFVADNVEELLESLYEYPENYNPRSETVGRGPVKFEDLPDGPINIDELVFGDRTYFRDDGVRVSYDQDKFPLFEHEDLYPYDTLAYARKPPLRVLLDSKNNPPDTPTVSFDREPGVAWVELRCERVKEVAEANAALGLEETPDGYSWHHTHTFFPKDGKIYVAMALVRTDVHRWAEHSAGTHLARDIMESKTHIGHSIVDTLSSIARRFSHPKLEITHSGKPLSPAAIDDFEARMGVKLPKDYRAFLQAHNGGRPSPRVCHYRARLYSDVPIQYFLSIGAPYPIDDVWNALKDPTAPRIPPEMIPIAESDCGDVLCLALGGPQGLRGQIFFWDHEREGVDSFTRDNLHLVADNIDALLASLRDH